MSGHIVTGGVFVSGTRSAFDPRVDDLEVDLTAVEEVVETANTNISGLTTQQATNIYNIGQNDIGVQFNAMGISTNATNITNLNVQQTSNTLTISNLDQVFVEKTGHNEIVGELEISGPTERFSVDHSGTQKLGKVSVGNTTSFETFDGVVYGGGQSPADDMDFVSSSTGNNSTVAFKKVAFCALDRTSTIGAFGPAITFANYGNYYGSSINHIGAICCQPVMAQSGTRQLFGDMCFMTGNPNNNPYLTPYLKLRSFGWLECTGYITSPNFVTTSDDRLKENEELIENACETLSKLRPQLYDKKSTMDNDNPSSWKRESGLIAQEIYYDAPELRHLVVIPPNPTNVEYDLKDDIDTSMNPEEDPDYSSWPEDPVFVNYTGLIAYLIKANNELNERLKTVEAMLS